MNNNQIVYIDISKIHPHPHNPRKSLGDLSELADSIKVSGILQNLTIVPMPGGPADEYHAVIGHRRHGAAKKAGLTQVPCVISDMDEKEQIRTMMVENINRSALTIAEEAEGFQMLLDLGDTIGEIADKTGFSKATVRRRVKLMELDSEKFRKSIKRGATLQDYLALEKIKDIDTKNKVLDTIGTSNFNYALKQAIDQEKANERKTALLSELKTFATHIEPADAKGLKQIQWFSLYGNAEFTKPTDAGQREYFFTDSYNIILYAVPTDLEKAESIAQNEQWQRQREHNQQLDHIAERAFILRYEFVQGLTGLKKQMPLISEMVVQSMLLKGWGAGFDGGMFLEGVGIEPDENEKFDLEMLSEPLISNPEKVLLMASYANMADSARNKYHGYGGKHQVNEALDLLYSYLTRLGYELSDEEQSYRDGSHELFREEKAEAAA